jgi:hypothetical protein
MALTPEDKGDVKKHLGKALANKVSKVTRDTPASRIKTSPYKEHMMKMGHYYGENRPSEKEWNREKAKDAAKSKALSKRTKAGKYDHPNRLTGSEKDALRKKHGANRLTGSMMDEGRSEKRNKYDWSDHKLD